MSSSSQTPGPAAANKRRRAEAANVALRKPFRSPMISRQAATAGEGDDGTRAGAANASPNVARAAAGAEAAARAVATAGTPRANPATRRGGHGAWPSTPASASRGSPLNQPSMRGSSSSLASRSGNSRLETLLAGKVSKKSSGSGQVLRRDGDVDDNDDYDAEDLLERMRQAERETGAHVRQLQQELNVVRQAKRIEQQSEQSRRLRRQSPPTAPTGDGGPSIIDAELRELVGKWKFASQQAAEELFELIKGRVAGMGGGKAWRETRRQQQQGFFAGFDDGDGHGSGATRRDHERDCNEECRCDDDDDDDVRREAALRGRADEEGDGGSGKEESEGDELDFTMLMMLKSLNIDPNVLGYDAVEDKWRD